MAVGDLPLSGLTTRGTPDRANDYIYVVNGATQYRSTINNELGITGTPVGTTDSQTLTNKTFTAPTITAPVINGTITGTYTLGGTPTFPATIVSTTGTQTLTNKTLTSPTITSPTITNASITADAISGFTTSNTGTIYGVAVTSGLIAGSAVTNIPAASLGTGAITLGYTQITGNVTSTSTTVAQVAGLTSTVTIPAGGRRVKVTCYVWAMTSTGTFSHQLSIWDGTVGSGTMLTKYDIAALSTQDTGICMIAVPPAPAAGSKTYNIGWLVSGGTGTLNAATTAPAFILVEAI